jgi:hypothetical protein
MAIVEMGFCFKSVSDLSPSITLAGIYPSVKALF